MNRVRCFLVLGLLPVVALRSTGADAELQALRARVEALEQELRKVVRELEAREQASAAPVHPPTAASREATPPEAAPPPQHLVVVSSNRQLRLRLAGNIQVDGRLFLSDAANGAETFLLRRIPLNLEGRMGDAFAFRVMPDFAPSNVTLLEAYASYQHSPALNLLIGKTKSPFDLERLVAQTDLLFIERAYPTTLSPNRDIGVQVFGAFAGGAATYQLAVLNGARDTEAPVVDVDNGKEFVARVFAHPFRTAAGSWFQGLGVGLAASTSDKSAGVPAALRTHAQQTYFTWAPGVSHAGPHTRIEPQAYWYHGPLGLIGSWISARQELSVAPQGSTRVLTNTAWYVAAHWVLTGEDAGYRGVTPARDFHFADGTPGAWELAARYGELSVDTDAFPLFANAATSARRAQGATFGMNWHLNRNVKASLNFEHTVFDGGVLNVVTRSDERAVLSRLQLRY